MTNSCRSAVATRARIRTAVIWALILSSVAAGSQAVSGAEPTLEEVVVSAEKRTERSQDVPIPVIAVNAVELERQGTRDLRDIAQRTASHLDRIFRGAKAGELPVEQPRKFELVLNMATARAIGYSPPQAFLSRVDRVIGRI